MISHPKATSGESGTSAVDILVVEENAIQAELLRRTLTLHGYTVHSPPLAGGGGDEGLYRALTQEER